ncbi:MAG: hypothetical protein NT091_05085 [Candidatus Falkowbacteria bacterium]|nr:hypothetical protein [Candidatus Falkowbacteria bacterium]
MLTDKKIKIFIISSLLSLLLLLPLAFSIVIILMKHSAIKTTNQAQKEINNKPEIIYDTSDPFVTKRIKR